MAYDDMDCPECGGTMVSRANKTTGQRFWGCSDYPRCKGTRNTDGEANRVKPAEDNPDLPSNRLRGNDRQRWMRDY